VTFSATGYANLEVDDFDVKLGEINDLDVELMK
jgi:hypothetical protein